MNVSPRPGNRNLARSERAPRATSTRGRVVPPRQVSLVDLLDRLIGEGVVIRGKVTLAAADVDLVYLDLALLLAAVDTAARGARR